VAISDGGCENMVEQSERLINNMDIQQSILNKAMQDKFTLVFDLPPILKPIARKYDRTNRK
jgi:hypothetical protein